MKKHILLIVENNSYLYDLLSLFIIIAAFGFLYRLMKQNRLHQLKHIRAASKTDDAPANDPVQALTSNVTFADVAGIKDVKEELEEIIDFL